MFQDADGLHGDELYASFVEEFLKAPVKPTCWKRLLEKDRPISEFRLNEAIRTETLDNKWILYAIAPKEGQLTQEEMEGLLDSKRWSDRKLTHQLWALIHLRERDSAENKYEKLIAELCERISSEQRKSVAVVDIYIQQTAFVLMAGHPERINRRWIERIIDHQEPDGGWNDR